MKYCSQCGHQLSDQDNFCDQCGAAVSDYSTNNSNTVAAVQSGSGRKLNWGMIFLIVFPILLIVGFLIYLQVSDAKRAEETEGRIDHVKESYFEFLPDITVGELINAYYGENYWIYKPDEGCVSFYGTNQKDQSGVSLDFQFVDSNTVTTPYIMYHNEGETAHSISKEQLKSYIFSLYQDYTGQAALEQVETSYSQLETAISTEPITTAKPETTQKQTEMATTEPPKNSVNYAMYSHLLSECCLKLSDYDASYCYYSLYDVDQDGTYEIMINIGNYTIDDTIQFFTIKNNDLIPLEQFCSYCTWLSEKDHKLYFNSGHNSYQMVQRIDLNGTQMTATTISEGDIRGDYTTYGTAVPKYDLTDDSPIKALIPAQNHSKPTVSAYAKTFVYTGYEGSESRLYVTGDFDYIEVVKALDYGDGYELDSYSDIQIYKKSECNDYIDLHYNASGEPKACVYITPYYYDGTSGEKYTCYIPHEASEVLRSGSVGNQPVNMMGEISYRGNGEICSYTTSYVCNGGACKKERDDLENGWHVTAKNRCYNYDITWYELWDSDDGDYYGWVDSNYIRFY